jgi:hypothetical protein
MSDKFSLFAAAVHAQFVAMSKHELFVVNIEGDAVYEAYQNAFPAGTNEIFRQAREHECSTCKNFIRNIGNVVAIIDGKIVTVWDVRCGDPTYDTVAEALNQLIRARQIKSIFRAEMPSYGVQKNSEPNATPGGPAIIWDHFFTGKIDKKHFAGDQAATQIGEANGKVQVFRRGMTEITRNAVETVQELLTTEGALYRGQEFAASFGLFVGLQDRYISMPSQAEADMFIWANFNAKGATLRNTAFGTLLINLSEGMDVEAAVKQWETVMAPTNYKRPTALITPRMVDDATKTIEQLGIEPSLQRRFATVEDVSVNDILFVDNGVRSKMKDGGVKGLLMDVAEKQRPIPEMFVPVDISIADFMATVLPQAKTMSLLVKNEHQANFVSLTAPVDNTAPYIFKWDNAFAWSYDGNITDSIKERVKAAGGAVDGALRISLAWFNYDDLDLHVIEESLPTMGPRGGRPRSNKAEIYFGNRGYESPMGGKLDVDMNAGRGTTREPVENVTYKRLTDGSYTVNIVNFTKRETNNPGFTLEMAVNGQAVQYSAKSSPGSGTTFTALRFKIANGQVADMILGAGIEGHAFSQEKWGIQTEKFAKVDTMMLSPNHWDDQAIGNKHYIFVLEGCKNPVPTRGIYNEFLKPELEQHRKVFEVLGNKTMAQPTENQLSGLGFSSTRGDTVTIQVNGHRNYNVKF